MTNDQKLVYLIHQVDELFKAQEKAEQTKSVLFIDDARKKRSALKIWLAGNKVVSAQAPLIRKKVTTIKKQTTRHNWLAQ